MQERGLAEGGRSAMSCSPSWSSWRSLGTPSRTFSEGVGLVAADHSDPDLCSGGGSGRDRQDGSAP